MPFNLQSSICNLQFVFDRRELPLLLQLATVGGMTLEFRLRTTRLAVAVALPCLLAVGCASQRVERQTPIFRPGQKLLLAVRTEAQAGGTVSLRSYSMEMPIDVKAGESAGETILAVSISRLTVGMNFLGKTTTEDSDLTPGPGADARELEFFARAQAAKRMRFTATLDAGGELTSFRSGQTDLNDLRSVATTEPELGMRAMACRSAIQDALSYLPPTSAASWQSWKVHRREVVPLHSYATFLLTGSTALTEEATCRLDLVTVSPAGRVAAVSFSGRREAAVESDAASRPSSNYLLFRGDLLVNLDTGVIDRLRIDSSIVSTIPGIPPGIYGFVETLTLRPR
jgi:hypothetical protein